MSSAVRALQPAGKKEEAASCALLLSSRGNTRVEEACEMYTRAANMFKIAKNWSGEYTGGAEYLCC